MSQGKVVGIFIASAAGAPLKHVQQIQALAGEGLEGDRYCNGQGTFTKPGDRDVAGQQATFIESEALEAIAREQGIHLNPGESRRNIVTTGIALNHLVNREFRVGEAVMRGIKLCEPCGHLEKLTKQGVKAALVHRGGLRAQILNGGTIRTGDNIQVLQVAEATA